MHLSRFACAMVAMVAIVGCGSSKDSPATTSPASEAVNQAFTGTLSDGSLVTLSFGSSTQAIRASALVASRSSAATGAVQVTGTITRLDGSVVSVSGTYDPTTTPGTFHVSGGEYSFTGTYEAGALQGSATVGGVTVKLVAAMGAATSVTQYCGTFETAVNETGAFNVVVSGGKAFGIAATLGGGVSFSGTASGTSVAMHDDKGTPINGTISGTSLTGTFTNSDGQGTFSGSVEACAAILNPPASATCTSFEYSAWGACQPGGTQSRTVVTSSPAGCQGGSPQLTQSCTYVPPVACDAPATNPATIIYDTLSTAATAPAAAGGTIVDGTYYRTAKTKFGQATSGTDKSSGTSQLQLVIAGSDIDVVVTESGVTSRFLGTAATNGTTLTITVTCSSDPVTQPVGSTMTLGYTASATSLKVYDSADDTEEVFSLQGVSPPALQCEAPASNPAGPSTEMDSTRPNGPPPAGGTIANGTYDLWNTVYYAASADSSATTSTDRRRMILQDGAIDMTISDATMIGRLLGTYTVNATTNTIDIVVTCSSDPTAIPVDARMSFPFTVDTVNVPGSTLLKLYTTSRDGSPKEEAYKLQ